MANPLPTQISDCGLSNRGRIVLERERRMMPTMVLAVEGEVKASPDGALKRLTMSLLSKTFRRGVDDDDGLALRAACFLAGRCAPPAGADAQKLDGWLDQIVGGLDVDDLFGTAPVFVESAMSIGLRGDQTRAGELLGSVAEDGGRGTSSDWLAAFYLAQYGDARGWPAMVSALEGSDEHTRLMATRHVFIFAALESAETPVGTIDTGARLIARLDDDSPYVAVEVPGLLAEADVPGLLDVLRDAAATNKHEAVRGAAADVLETVQRDGS